MSKSQTTNSHSSTPNVSPNSSQPADTKFPIPLTIETRTEKKKGAGEERVQFNVRETNRKRSACKA